MSLDLQGCWSPELAELAVLSARSETQENERDLWTPELGKPDLVEQVAASQGMPMAFEIQASLLESCLG